MLRRSFLSLCAIVCGKGAASHASPAQVMDEKHGSGTDRHLGRTHLEKTWEKRLVGANPSEYVQKALLLDVAPKNVRVSDNPQGCVKNAMHLRFCTERGDAISSVQLHVEILFGDHCVTAWVDRMCGPYFMYLMY